MRADAETAPLALAPGRSCPLHYRYSPEVFATEAPAALRGLEVLYVVGGLYGSAHALAAVLALFNAERGRKRLVFNGDFHWFDADAAAFASLQRTVLIHTALRGNVETELAVEPTAAEQDPDAAPVDAGCGCAYPSWVGDAVVQRSNRILQRLRQVVTPEQRLALRRLPMWLRADVGPLRLGIVHGDAQSLAGWGFAQEHLRDAAHRAQVMRWFEAAQVDAFASTHTCLPVFQALGAHTARPRWVLNNGAAGMPNFAGDAAGLITRVALKPFKGAQRRYGFERQGVHVDALAVDTDAAEVQRRFLELWPEGSDAHASYFERIVAGPSYSAAEAVRLGG
jgi:hypothetical protein